MKKALTLALAFAALFLASCASPGGSCPLLALFTKPDLAALADRALTVAVASGKVKPSDAELVREGGALILAAANKEQISAERISALAVKAAVAEGALTADEAALLTAQKSVPLTPAD